MHDDQAPTKLGLTDDELAVQPTVFAADALKNNVVVVSGGAGGIGRAVAFQPDDARGLGLGRRRGLRLSRRAVRQIHRRRNVTVDGGGPSWGETWTGGKPDYFQDPER